MIDVEDWAEIRRFGRRVWGLRRSALSRDAPSYWWRSVFHSRQETLAKSTFGCWGSLLLAGGDVSSGVDPVWVNGEWYVSGVLDRQKTFTRVTSDYSQLWGPDSFVASGFNHSERY